MKMNAKLCSSEIAKGLEKDSAKRVPQIKQQYTDCGNASVAITWQFPIKNKNTTIIARILPF